MSENVHGYEITGDWNQANEGKWACATKAGKSYFVKQYTNHYTEPDASKIGKVFSEASYNSQLEAFNKFKAKRNLLNVTLKRIAGQGGNIVFPLDYFVYDHHYTEVSDLYSDHLTDDEIVTLTPSQKHLLLKSLASTLNAIHHLGIVHGDIKPSNVICTKNKIGTFVLKLIDFGAAFFSNDKPSAPSEYSGDPCYASPELGQLWMSKEDEDADPQEYIDALSEKSDIFALGILFHFFLTGESPTYQGVDIAGVFHGRSASNIYPFEILLNGGTLGLSENIDDPRYAAIIPKMLELDPEKRPTCSEVLRALNQHKITVNNTKNKDEASDRNKENPSKKDSESDTEAVPTAKPEESAQLKNDNNPVNEISPDENIDSPWENDSIKWTAVLNEFMAAEKYTKLKRDRNFLGKPVYSFFKEDDTKTMIPVSVLIEKGVAERTILDTSDYGDTKDILRDSDKSTLNVNSELLTMMNVKLKPGIQYNGILNRQIEGYELLNTEKNKTSFYSTTTLVRVGILIPKHDP